MKLAIPEFALVALVGVSGSGKSTFARRHFKPTEILSSDHYRALLVDDEGDQVVTGSAFALLNHILRKRLEFLRLTVIDSTSVQVKARKSLLKFAHEYHCPSVAIVLDVPLELALARDRSRERVVGEAVIREQFETLRRARRHIEQEGFDRVYILSEPESIDSVEIVRERLPFDLKHEQDSFDIIGDVHGCFDELTALLAKLGYAISEQAGHVQVIPPEGRKAVFLGDYVDRGPNTPAVLRLAIDMADAGTAICIPGNHDVKLVKALMGRAVQRSRGMQVSLAQLAHEPPAFSQRIIDFINRLPPYVMLDAGRLVVAHGGLKAFFHGRISEEIRAFTLYGDATGEMDAAGFPVRRDWAAEYHGAAMVVYGHTPMASAEWINNTINIDTGCVFGGALTALRYPERDLVSVRPLYTYAHTNRSFMPDELKPPERIVWQDD